MLEITNALAGPTWMNLSQDIDPTFIIKRDSRRICKVNERVMSGCNNYNPIGKKIGDVVHIENSFGDIVTPVYFDEEWFILRQETLIWKGIPHIKVQLKERKGVPDFETMQSLKHIIGFLLHRVRSPLTGIQGYTELAESKNKQKDIGKYLTKINIGIEELFDLLSDLDTLQEISLDTVDNTNFSAKPEKIISDILAEYDDHRKNIEYHANDINYPMQCNPGDMRKILSLLIENAIEFAPIKDHNIIISHPSANTIKIAHSGNSISKSISEKVFSPFVTSKARKLGIGLTVALLYAKRYNGSIFLTDNNPFKEVAFVFCLPPTSPSTQTFI